MTRCAECGAPGADRGIATVDKRLASDLRYCRNCYEQLAARLMRPYDERKIETTLGCRNSDYREQGNERT